jgi:hypothetical protein
VGKVALCAGLRRAAGWSIILLMTPNETRAALEQLALQPSRALGQNFLVDRNIAYLIVAAAGLRADDTVLEIGPGLGALTGLLLEHAGRVVAVEKDGRLFEFLRERFARSCNWSTPTRWSSTLRRLRRSRSSPTFPMPSPRRCSSGSWIRPCARRAWCSLCSAKSPTGSPPARARRTTAR